MDKSTIKEALAALQPGSVAAKVRTVMPVIEEQIARGVSHRDIVAALNAGGIAIEFTNFESILYRYRRKHGKQGAAQAQPVSAQPVAPAQGEAAVHTPDNPQRPDLDVFARTLDPETRYETADRLMSQSRRWRSRKNEG